MTKTYTMLMILALGAPAAAELAAPELPFIDAAVVRSQPFEKESINIGAAFPGMQACKFTGVQGDTCSFACKDGSTVKRPRLNSTVAQNGGCPIMVMVPSGNKASPVIRTAEDIYFRSSLHSSREKADAALQRILKDAKVQDIPVKGLPTVEPQGKYYSFRINFGPGMYIDKVESYGMTHSNEAMIISGIELGGGIHLETKYEAERGMSVYYVMPEGKEPQEIDAD